MNLRKACLCFLLLSCLGSPVAGYGATEGDGPSRLDFRLLEADAAARTLDIYSTRHALEGCTCNHEAVFPGGIAYHTSSLIAAESIVWGSEYLAVSFLEKHHHPILAHLLPALDAVSTGYFASKNLTLRTTP